MKKRILKKTDVLEEIEYFGSLSTLNHQRNGQTRMLVSSNLGHLSPVKHQAYRSRMETFGASFHHVSHMPPAQRCGYSGEQMKPGSQRLTYGVQVTQADIWGPGAAG